MTDELNRLIKKLQFAEHTDRLINLEARVWQRLDADRLPLPRTLLLMQALRAAPVVLTLVLGGTFGARAMISHDNSISAFSAAPSYSVLRLVK